MCFRGFLYSCLIIFSLLYHCIGKLPVIHSHKSFFCRCLSESEENSTADLCGFCSTGSWFLSAAFPGVFLAYSDYVLCQLKSRLLFLTSQNAAKISVEEGGKMPGKADHRSPGLLGSILCDIIFELLCRGWKEEDCLLLAFLPGILQHHFSNWFPSESENNNPITKPLIRYICIRNIEVSEFPKPSVSVRKIILLGDSN